MSQHEHPSLAAHVSSDGVRMVRRAWSSKNPTVLEQSGYPRVLRSWALAWRVNSEPDVRGNNTMRIDVHTHFQSLDFIKHLLGRSGLPKCVLAGGDYVVQCRSESTRLISSHVAISYAVFCLKKK